VTCRFVRGFARVPRSSFAWAGIFRTLSMGRKTLETAGQEIMGALRRPDSLHPG
jgi:hypothetical protein